MYFSIHPVLKLVTALLASGLFASASFADDKAKTNVAFELTLPSLGLSIYNNTQSIDFETNNNLIPKLGFSRGHYGLSYGYGSGKLDEEINLSTTSHDFQGFYYFNKHGFDFYYQSYRGYYIDRLPLQNDSYYPDLTARTYTFNYYYKLGGDNKLSAMSTPLPSTKRVSSLYFLLGSISDRSLKSSNFIIPTGNSNDFFNISNMKHFHVLNATLSAGAFFPMNFNKWYFNPGLSAGFGSPVFLFKQDFKPSYSVKVNLKANMGYAGKKYRFGLEVSNDSDAFEDSADNTLQFHSILVNLVVLSYSF